MNRLVLPCLLALAACAPPPKPPDREQSRLREELAVVAALKVQDVSHLRVGQWALYTVRTEGSHSPLATRIAAVASDPSGRFWIENRTQAGDETVVYKLLIDKSGTPVELWVGNLTRRSEPAKVFPGVDASGRPIDAPKPGADPQMKVEVAREKVDLGMGKVFNCARLTSRSAYPDGRHTEFVTWCSPDVPFPVVHEGKSYGGVVKRTYARHTLQLSAQGIDAMEELPLPRK
jgi:hypothetical protein